MRGMSEGWRELREVHQRLRWARMNRTPFPRPTDAARSLNMRPGTYRTYELSKADGGRAPSLMEIQRIARKFKVSWSWIATGEGSPDDEPKNELKAIIDRLAERVSEVDPDKQDDALAAVEGVLAAFRRKLG